MLIIGGLFNLQFTPRSKLNSLLTLLACLLIMQFISWSNGQRSDVANNFSVQNASTIYRYVL
jgi:NADH:ubiquinone oxidoreductase subunit 2 (subunit N)